MADDLSTKRQEILERLRIESQEREAERKARSFGLRYTNLKKAVIQLDALQILEEETARQAEMVIFDKMGKILAVALTNPENPKTIETLLKLEEKGYKLNKFLVSPLSLTFALTKYELIKKPQPAIAGLIDVEPFPSIGFQKLNETVKNTKNIIITDLMAWILKSAVLADASDIHFEPQENQVLVRFRLDGVLYEILRISFSQYRYLRDRLKLLAGMRVNITNEPQDGRFSIKNGPAVFEVRASALPGPKEEFLVFRLLNPERMAYGLEDLGLRPDLVPLIKKELGVANGLILNTGPTGSGKTTTLYAMLKQKISPGIKIITIENPIEYRLRGVTQTEVDESKNYDFKNGLKSILRQDPDVILVGEIRDKETANIAIQASLTGHLVLSTLHTNEAADTISRLLELGIERKLLPSSLRLIIAQRLVRRLCPYCKEPYEPDEELKKQILESLSIISPKAKLPKIKEIKTLYRAKGCEKCFYLGYKGQTAIMETLVLNPKINDLILKEGTIDEIRELAIDEGMVPMFHDGLLKALEGVTSLEEVGRVTGDISYIQSLYQRIISRVLTRGFDISEELKNKAKQFIEQPKGRIFIYNNLAISEQLPLIVTGGILSEATDIHLEPQEKEFIVRYRLDGVLNEILKNDIKFYPPLINQLKEITNLEMATSQKVQEGRFNVRLDNKNYNIRVSLLPGGYGESAALRLLTEKMPLFHLEKLGLFEPTLSELKKMLKPTGILLVCGPTSSGKTTTLFAILNTLNQVGVKIITIEDPIEYRLEGVVQTQINEETGYTFSQALKTILRQNPNIILIGEIRDEETAKLASQAALTGHLILASLHTNDALSAIDRLASYKLDKTTIGNGLNGILSQRLIRQLCPHCKKPVALTKSQKDFISEKLKELPTNYRSLVPSNWNYIYKPTGCSHCHFTGYKGQTAIFEIIEIDENLRHLINEGLNYDELKERLKGHYLSLELSGYLRLLDGTTSLEELHRVLGLSLEK